MKQMTHDDVRDATGAVRDLLAALGQDTRREGLVQTPHRVVRFLADFCNPQPFNFTTFESEGMDEMVTQSNIPFASLCEHHMLPFTGTAAVAYIPDGRIVGLSKLARTVQFCASGLQNQERVTQAIATMLINNLKPQGVGVVLRARHSCMELRGVRAANVWTTTSCLRGALLTDEKARAEFLRLARKEE